MPTPRRRRRSPAGRAVRLGPGNSPGWAAYGASRTVGGRRQPIRTPNWNGMLSMDSYLMPLRGFEACSVMLLPA